MLILRTEIVCLIMLKHRCCIFIYLICTGKILWTLLGNFLILFSHGLCPSLASVDLVPGAWWLTPEQRRPAPRITQPRLRGETPSFLPPSPAIRRSCSISDYCFTNIVHRENYPFKCKWAQDSFQRIHSMQECFLRRENEWVWFPLILTEED